MRNNADKMELNINLLRPGAQNNTNSITFSHFYCSQHATVTHHQIPKVGSQVSYFELHLVNAPFST